MNAVGHGFLIIVGSSADVRHTKLSSDSPFKQVRAPKMLENIGRDSTLEDPGCIICESLTTERIGKKETVTCLKISSVPE